MWQISAHFKNEENFPFTVLFKTTLVHKEKCSMVVIVTIEKSGMTPFSFSIATTLSHRPFVTLFLCLPQRIFSPCYQNIIKIPVKTKAGETSLGNILNFYTSLMGTCTGKTGALQFNHRLDQSSLDFLF